MKKSTYNPRTVPNLFKDEIATNIPRTPKDTILWTICGILAISLIGLSVYAHFLETTVINPLIKSFN